MILELFMVFSFPQQFLFLRDLIRATSTEQKKRHRSNRYTATVHDDKNARAQSYKLSCKTITKQPPNAFSVLPLFMPPRPTRLQQSKNSVSKCSNIKSTG